MTCDTAEPWVLVARSADDLSERVRRHLTGCPRCVGLLTRLTRLDEATARLAPLANSTGRARLDACLARTPQDIPTPQAEPAPEPVRQRKQQTVPRWFVGLAAAALLAGGWAAGHRGSRPTSPGPELSVAEKPTRAPAALSARVAGHAAKVAEDASPKNQFDALARVAAEVRTEAVRLATNGDAEQLPRLVGLHDRVIRFGVIRQLGRIPEATRSTVATGLADDLRKAADEMTATVGQLPQMVGELLRPLQTSCSDTATRVRQFTPVAPTPANWPTSPTPLETVVAQMIRVADADAPMARADAASDLAAALAQVISLLALAGQPDDAARVGEALDAVLDRGVAANLDRVEGADPTGKLRDEVAKLRERSARATEVLERNLAKAPAAARAGLERALAASDPGRGKATGKGSGKPGTGPPWKKGDGEHPGKGATPPGWQKKP